MEEYGDPADDITVEATEEESAESDYEQPSDVENNEKIDVNGNAQFPIEDLSNGKLEVLRVVAEGPATQLEIGERLGVSALTVSERVTAIDGFDWQHRQQAVQDFRVQDSTENTRIHDTMATNETEPTADTDRLDERIDALEQRVASTTDTASRNVDIDPELIHKVVHACFKSEAISEYEELELLKTFLPDEA